MSSTKKVAPTKKRRLRDMIREAVDGKHEKVVVPEWTDDDGEPVELMVVSMDGERRARYLKAAMTEDGEVNFAEIYPQLIIATAREVEVVEVNGSEEEQPGVAAFEPEDADWLNSKNAAALERVAKVAMRLSGMSDDDRKQAGKGS